MTRPERTPAPPRRSRLGRVLGYGLALGLAVGVSSCGSDSPDQSSPAATDGSLTTVADGGEAPPADGHVEPDYDGLPADLTGEEVCALLDDETVVDVIGAEIISTNPGTSRPDCTWMYKVEDGPVTTLQVQVMSMSDTDERLGTEALEWGLDRAPDTVDIVDWDAIEVPNGGYEFGEHTVVFAIDPVGRLFTVSIASDRGEEALVAMVEATLAALTEHHA